jgi:hypothetical protein
VHEPQRPKAGPPERIDSSSSNPTRALFFSFFFDGWAPHVITYLQEIEICMLAASKTDPNLHDFWPFSLLF